MVDVFKHPKFAKHTLKETAEQKNARHHRLKFKADKEAQLFAKDTEMADLHKPKITSSTLNADDLGKEVQVIAGARCQEGALVGRIFNKLLIEFPNGKTKMVADHLCRFNKP